MKSAKEAKAEHLPEAFAELRFTLQDCWNFSVSVRIRISTFYQNRIQVWIRSLKYFLKIWPRKFCIKLSKCCQAVRSR